MTKKAMNKEEMTQIIKDLAEKLGRVPTMIDLERMAGINKNEVRKTLGTYRDFVESCGIEGRRTQGQKVSTHELFLDWAGVVRKMGKIPTITEYQLHGSYNLQAFVPMLGKLEPYCCGHAGLHKK